MIPAEGQRRLAYWMGFALLATSTMAVSARQLQPSRATVSAVTARSGWATLAQRQRRWLIRIPAPLDVVALLNSPNKAGRVTVPVSLAPGTWLPGVVRPDKFVEVELSQKDFVALTPGANHILLQAPGWKILTFHFDAAPALRADSELRDYCVTRMNPVPLLESNSAQGAPAGKTVAATNAEIVPPSIPGLQFVNPPNTALTLSSTPGQAPLRVPLTGKARKLFVLLACGDGGGANLTGHCIIRCADGEFLIRPFHVGVPDSPPSPEPDAASCVTWSWNTPSGKLHTVEVDLGEIRALESISLDADSGSSLTLAGVTIFGSLKPGTYAKLPRRFQAVAAAEPFTLFVFDHPSLGNWDIQGSGWGTTDTVGEFFMRKGTSRYFADSKAIGGETATGTILSPTFVISGGRLQFLANGHGAKNYYALVDVGTGAELRRAPAPEKTGPFEKVTWDVKDLKGRRVRFKAVDNDDRAAYAWIAFDEITLLP